MSLIAFRSFFNRKEWLDRVSRDYLLTCGNVNNQTTGWKPLLSVICIFSGYRVDFWKDGIGTGIKNRHFECILTKIKINYQKLWHFESLQSDDRQNYFTVYLLKIHFLLWHHCARKSRNIHSAIQWNPRYNEKGVYVGQMVRINVLFLSKLPFSQSL